MRIKAHRQGGYESGGLTLDGGKMVGPLTLFRNPLEGLEAVTKQYVDALGPRLGPRLDAASITTGILPDRLLAAWQGDVTTDVGGRVTTIGGVVTPGEYTAVDVSDQGRVVGGSGMSAEDVPGLDWSKFTKGMPSDSTGYGILDGISTKGDVLEGYLILEDNPVLDEEISSKTHTDGLFPIVEVDRLKIGDIIQKATGVTPTNFLQCNGGAVDKELYAGLYAVIGDRFNIGGNSIGTKSGGGKPWKLQYGINTVGDSLGAWTTATSLPGGLYYSQAIVTSNRVYLLGGRISGTGYVSTVYTAPINEDGTLGAWTTDTSLPGVLSESQAIVTSSRVYLLGGRVNNGSGVSTVRTAPINEDGTLGAWATGTSLPGALAYSQAIVTSNRVYLLGGLSSGWTSTIYTAPINEDGTLGAWTTAPNSLPIALIESQAIVTSNRVYLLGGRISGSTLSTIYTAPINEDGTLGTWTTATNSLPGVLYASQAIVTSNRVYLLGGQSGSAISTVYTAPINEDGTLGTWTTGTSLPGVLSHSQAIVTSSRVYLLGGAGSDNNLPLTTVYTATFSGGKNDYSECYGGTTNHETISVNEFRLPNYSLEERVDFKHYIKYS